MLNRARSLTIAAGIAGALLLGGLPSMAAAGGAGALGRQLVNRFFTDVRNHNFADLRKFLSPAFQVQRADGTRQTKAQFLAKFPVVISFQLRDFHVTSAARTIVATYQANAFEIISGKRFRTGYEPRISVFLKGARGWQLVAHGNFNKPQ